MVIFEGKYMHRDTVIESILAHATTMKASQKAAVADMRSAKRRSKIEATTQKVAFWDETARAYTESLKHLAAVLATEIEALERLVPSYSTTAKSRSRGSK